MQLDSRVVNFWNRTYLALTYFVENCLDLPKRYLKNEDISKVLVTLIPKISQFTCDKRFITFAQVDIYPLKTCANLVQFTNTNMHT